MIPWSGDMVRLNPEGSKHSYLGEARRNIKDVVRVDEVHVVTSNKTFVNVKLANLMSFDLAFPGGQFYADYNNVAPMFEFISGDDKRQVESCSLDPVPVPGNIFEYNGYKGKVLPCSCGGDFENNWPNGDMDCGAHLENHGNLCYRQEAGWLFDGTLFRMNEAAIDEISLKAANTMPEATVCARCGGRLRDPHMGPMFKYCPKCEP